MFEVGQKVWDIIAGGGTVDRIYKGYTYPVLVKFADGGEGAYTTDGKEHENHTIPTIYPYPVEIVKKITKPAIDWEHVHNKFKWIAQDAEGGCGLYEDRPDKIDGEWVCSSGDCTSAEGFISLIPGTCDWKDSLVARPEGA